MRQLLKSQFGKYLARHFGLLLPFPLALLLLGAPSGAQAQNVQFSSDTFSVPENTYDLITISVPLSEPADGYATVDYTFTDGSAFNGVDYMANDGTLAYQDGDTNAYIYFVTLDNQLRDGDRTFTISLANATGNLTLAPPSDLTVTILDDDTNVVLRSAGAFQFTTDGYVTSEGDPSVLITVTRAGAAAGRVLVDYTVTDDTAKNGTDYGILGGGYLGMGTLVFEDFQMSSSFYVPLLETTVISNTPTRFFVTLSDLHMDPNWHEKNLVPSLGIYPQASVYILDNDYGFNFEQMFYTDYAGYLSPIPPPIKISVQIASGNKHKDGCTVRYKVRQIPKADSTIRAPFGFNGQGEAPNLIAGSDFAKDGVDFNSFTGTLTFGSNDWSKSFDLPLLPWTIPEFNKDLRIELYSPGGKFILNGTNEIDSYLGRVTNANLTIIPLGEIGVSWGTSNGVPWYRTVANAEPAGAVDLTWTPDHVSWSVPMQNMATPGANNTVYSILVQPDDKVLVAGAFSSINTVSWGHIARLDFRGDPDPEFQIGTGADDFIDALALYTNGVHNGKIIIGGGFTSFNGTSRYRIARLNSNGSIDSTFSPGTGVEDGLVRAVAIQPDDKVLIAGQFTTVNGVTRQNIARLNADGSVDTTFNPGTGPEAGANDVIWTVAVMSSAFSNSIVIGGDFTNVNGVVRTRVARLNSNGTLNQTFDPAFGPDATVYSVVVQPDDKILLGGAFTQITLKSRNGIARLNPDGSLDSSFDPGTGTDNVVYGLKLQPDSKILAVGAFQSYNDTRRIGITRLHPFGVVDTSFLDTGYNQYAGIIDRTNFVTTVDVQSDGKVIVGGFFQRLGGGYSRTDWHPRWNLARLIGGSTPGPGYVEFNRAEFTADEFGGYLYAPLNRRDGKLGPLFVSATFTDGLAQSGVDYTPWTTTTGFNYWNSPPDYYLADGYVNTIVYNPAFSARIINDGLIEGNENFILDLVPPFNTLPLGGLLIPMGSGLGLRHANCVIVDDDFNRGEFNFSSPSYIVNENAAYAVVTILRTNGSSGEISVDLSVVLGTNSPALPYVDYIPTNRVTLSFGNAETSRTFSIRILDDYVVEPDETFLVKLSNPRGGGTIGAQSNAVVTIVDDDYKPGRLSFSSAAFTENEVNPYALITVQRRGGTLGQVSVDYSTLQDTAVPGINYLPTNGTLIWYDGDASDKTFTVPLVNNGLVEGNKMVVLTLNQFSNALPGSVTNAKLTIVDDDAYGNFDFSSANYVTDENGGSAIITVVRTAGIAGSVSIDYATMSLGDGPGAAIPGTHYSDVSDTLYFEPNQLSATFQVPIINETTTEGDHALKLMLSNPGGGAALGLRSTALLTIVDDESVRIPAGSLDPTFSESAGANSFIYALALQANGDIVIGGDFTAVASSPRNHFARFHSDGNLDSAFATAAAANGPLNTIALQPDGRFVLGGAFTTYNSTNRNNIVRVQPDSTPDLFFNPGSGANNTVNIVALQYISGAQKVLVGGAFTDFNGVGRNSLTRLNDNGTVDTSFTIGSGANGPVYALAVQPDGKVLVGGDFGLFNGVSNRCIVRLNTNGAIDSTFVTGSGANGAVRAIIVQSDGSVVLGGAFSAFNGNTNASRLVRLDMNGAIDTNFLANIGVSADAVVLALALQIDGKLLVGGEFTSFNNITRNRLTRLNPDGSVDPTINFGSGANNFVGAIVVQPDRNILIAGGFTTYNGEPRAHLARIHGGSLAGSGSLEFSATAYTNIEANVNAVIEVRRTGGTAGTVTVDCFSIDQTAAADADYVLVNTNLTFAEGETLQLVYVPILDDNLIEDDETLLLVLTNVTGGAVLGTKPTATLIILNDDSQVSFSASSYSVTENFSLHNAIISLTRTGALTTTVSVEYHTTPITARPNVDYTPVSGTVTFWPQQTSATFNVPIIDNPEIDPNLTILLTLTNISGQGRIASPSNAVLTIIENDTSPGLVTFATNAVLVKEGAINLYLDVIRTNGHTGPVSVHYATSDGTAVHVTGVNDGDYIGASTNLNFADGELVRTIAIPILQDFIVEGNETFEVTLSNPAGGLALGAITHVTVTIEDDDFGPGSLDPTFDPGSGTDAYVRSLVMLPDDRIVIGGAFTHYHGSNNNYIARVLTNGLSDPTFYSGSGASALINSVSLQTNGNLVIGGSFTTVNGQSRKRIARLQSNGALDPNLTADTGLNSIVWAACGTPENKFLAGGNFTTPQPGLSRLQVNGALDTSFNTGAGITNGYVYAILLDNNGKAIVGGSFTEMDHVPRTKVLRVNPLGSVDLTFTPPVITGGNVYALALQADGKVIIAGDFTNMNAITRTRIARLNTDGTLDSGFAPATITNGIIYAAKLQSDGKVLVGGSFTNINNQTRNRIARFLTNGDLDPSFDPGLGANGTVYAIGLQRDGQIIIGGAFSSVNGFVRNGLARLNGEPTQPPDLLPGCGMTNGVFTLVWQSQAGRTYIIEACTNFLNWAPISTNSATADISTYNDNAGLPYRFYRVTTR